MTMKIYKVGEVVEKHVSFCKNPRFHANDLAAIITNLEMPAGSPPAEAWTFDLETGEGWAKRTLRIEIPPLFSKPSNLEAPFFLTTERYCIVYFCDRLFMPERVPLTESEREEVILRVKKAVYDEDAEISALRSAVANLEAAIQIRRLVPKRDPIPEDVKLIVWARDGGACVHCGSKQNLHFDHIIPVVKGGGNSEANIQILCAACNLKKSDKIAIT